MPRITHSNLLKTDLALRRYIPILGYLQYENSTYWTRSNFFLTSNTLLLGFFLNIVPYSTQAPFIRLFTIYPIAVAGNILCWLWLQTLQSGSIWINHWHNVLQSLEPQAFNHIHVFSDVEEIERRTWIKLIAKSVPLLFMALWMLALGYLRFVASQKAKGLELF